MIIGITGTLGAGKGTVVDLLKKRGFLHYSARKLITEEILERGLEVNRDTLVEIGNELRQKNSPSYIAEKLFAKASKEDSNCVIESLRTLGEIETLKKKGDFFLLAVDASPEIRYKRVRNRKSETDLVSFEKFMEDERREMTSADINKQNLKTCIEMADAKIINDGTFEELERDVEMLLDKLEINKKPIKIKQDYFPERISKRKDYISWDDYFMGIALLSAKRSKDPNTQIGACIVDQDNKIVGIGYNGFPIGCSDEELPWEREGSFLETKYAYVCHAELNAILNSRNANLRKCKIYVPLFPCNECAKAIIQSGIREVIYLSDKYADTESVQASKKMLQQAGVKFVKYIPKLDQIKIDYSAEKV